MEIKSQNKEFIIPKRDNVKFILINDYSKQKNLFLKYLNFAFKNKNKNNLFTKKSLKSSELFNVLKMESFSFTAIQKAKNDYRSEEYSNIIFDLSDCSKNINNIINFIKELDWVWLKKGGVKSKDRNLWIIFNINLFSLQNNAYSLEFYNNFYKKVLKHNHNYFNSYKPSETLSDYNNNSYIVNVVGGYKQTKIVTEIYDENYDLWFINNFVDLRSNFTNCFLKISKKSINTRVSQVLNKIFKIDNYMNPTETQIIDVKNKEIIDKIKLSMNKKTVIYLFVEGNDDRLFFEQLQNSFPFIKFKIFTIANTTFNDGIATYIKHDLDKLTTIFIMGIFDYDDDGKQYKIKYGSYFNNSKYYSRMKNIFIIPPIDYSSFTPSKNTKITLEKLLYYHTYGHEKEPDIIQKDRVIKELLYDDLNIFHDTKKLVNSYLFGIWISTIRNLEFVD